MLVFSSQPNTNTDMSYARIMGHDGREEGAISGHEVTGS